MKLEPWERRRIEEALADAFRSEDGLADVVFYELGGAPGEVFTAGALLGTIRRQLVGWAEENDAVERLLDGAVRRRPTNRFLQAVAAELLLDERMGGVASTGGTPRDAAARLERMVLKNVDFEHVAQWREAMERCERCVCRIEYADHERDETVLGTGFLLAPGTAITNYHVLERVIDGAVDPGHVKLRFDYKRGVKRDAAKSEFTATGGKGWLIETSKPEELDFALFRVAGEPGKTVVAPGGQQRGWLVPKRLPVAVGDPFFILQHPNGEVMQIAGGAITGRQQTGNRVVYSTNTLEGSSGSPCFTMGWDLLALHHGATAGGNLGVAFDAILDALGPTALASDGRRPKPPRRRRVSPGRR